MYYFKKNTFSLEHIYKLASTLKDSLENRLKREGYIEGIIDK